MRWGQRTLHRGCDETSHATQGTLHRGCDETSHATPRMRWGLPREYDVRRGVAAWGERQGASLSTGPLETELLNLVLALTTTADQTKRAEQAHSDEHEARRLGNLLQEEAATITGEASSNATDQRNRRARRIQLKENL